MVVAPVGYGKTTLLGQWSAARPGTVRWCTPLALPDADALIRDCGGPGALSGVVIDDVADDQVRRPRGRLVRLIEQLAPTVPVILAARRMPAFNLARHEFPHPVVVTARDLAFRTWEITGLFADVYGDALGAEEALTIAERTDGWAASLRLWHLARRLRERDEEEDRDAEPGAFGGLLHGYLDREVLSALGAGSRRLLARSAAFDCVSAQRLDLLLGRQDCHHTLTRIARKVSLVDASASSSDGPHYRYHVALRRNLRSELVHELGVDGTRHLFARAAEVAEELGDLGEAGAARCRANDAPGLAALIERHGPSRVTSNPGTLDLVTTALSRQHPAIALARADLLLHEGRAHEARREVSQAAQLVARPEVTAEVVRRATSGQIPVTLEPGSPGAEALRLLAQQGPRHAKQALTRGAGGADEPGGLMAELALAALDVLVDPASGLTELERVDDHLRTHGLRWLRRLAHAVARCCTAEPQRCAEVLRLAAARERLGDRWGAALIESSVALALLRHGRPDADLLERLCERFRLLGAPALEAWARSALALASAQDDVPDSDVATSAVAFAQAGGAPGPLAVAYAALALSKPDLRAELLTLAQATAREGGLTCRPWTWSRDPAPAVRDAHRSRPVTAGGASSGRSAIRPHAAPGAFDAVDASARAALPAAPPAHPAAGPWGGLALRCFGTFAVTARDGAGSLAGVRPIALTVLRMLAVQAGSPVHRDVIVEAQWPELREQPALHNLHVSVSNLRRGLETLVPGHSRELLARQGQAYVLAPGEEAVTDLQRFDRLLAEASRCRRAGERTGQGQALRAALGLYAGEVLPGDGAAEWVVTVREHYRLLAAGAAAQLAQLELSREHSAAAVAAAQRSVQIDPWRDSSWRTLIAAHAQAGEPAESERAKQEYAAVLASLGISTMPLGPAHAAPVAAQPRAVTGQRVSRVRTA
ncbi:BTAD domain-containing putative transcriptional regulator [Knoellia aerolata]|uniref:BTAD domain-containing putative transcriptional regulator n=1 Tax=Knoellia aerolata TaxID=442954 RepID=UPI0012ED4DAF|nr:BTAD domain-containing putative transcriptional regulator [Knoellia aerolata]